MTVTPPLSTPPNECLGRLALRLHQLPAVFTTGCLLLAASALFAAPLAGDTSAEKDIPADIENLRTFANAYGYIRFFHPSDEASEVDWNRFAVYGAREVIKAERSADLRSTLERLFLPIAPTIQFFPADALLKPPPPLLDPVEQAGMEGVAWQHQGVSVGKSRAYQSVRMNREGGESFGRFGVRIEAKAYRGHQVKVQAAARSEVRRDGNEAQLWLRTERWEPQEGFFNNLQHTPATEREWKSYVIVGDVADDINHIYLGGSLKGAGRAWFDDFELFTRENEDAEWRSIELGNAGFEMDSVGEAPAGWAKNASRYAFTVTADNAFAGERSLLIESLPLFDQHPRLGEMVERPIGKDLAIQVPLALASKDGRTIRPAHAPDPSELMAALESIALDDAAVEDASVRYGGVIITWNVMQHFY